MTEMEPRLKAYKALIWLTLYAAALHFFDNVYFFDRYPEPAWLTAPIVGALWIPLALLAHRAVDYVYRGRAGRSYTLIHSFVLANWISLGHYLFAPPTRIVARINLAIGLQVALAAVLLGYTLWLQATSDRASLRWAARAWRRNVVMYAAAVAVLELLWPSAFDPWWMPWAW